MTRRRITVGSLFSGIGGLDLGLERAGMEVIWQSEIDPFACRVLAKHWPGVPNLGDITKIDWTGVERPTVLCGGFPCQDLSLAGIRRGLTKGERSGLWSEMHRAINELRPEFVLIENVPGLLSGGDDVEIGPDECACGGPPDADGTCPACGTHVGEHTGELVHRSWMGALLADLAEIGYDATWDCIPALAVGAPHRRDRVWIVAYPQGERGPDGTERDPRFVFRPVAWAGDRVDDRGAPAGVGVARGGASVMGRVVADSYGSGRGSEQSDVRAGEPDVARGRVVADAGSGGWVGWPGVEGVGREAPERSETLGDVGDRGGARGSAVVAHADGEGLGPWPGRPGPGRVTVAGGRGESDAASDGSVGAGAAAGPGPDGAVADADPGGRDGRPGARDTAGWSEPADRGGVVADPAVPGRGGQGGTEPGSGDGTLRGGEAMPGGCGEPGGRAGRHVEPGVRRGPDGVPGGLGRGLETQAAAWADGSWLDGIALVANGIPERPAKLRALGNAVVPQVSEHLGRLLVAALEAE